MNIPDLQQKAESGSVVAQSILGACYLDGIEVEVDYERAFRLLSVAATRTEYPESKRSTRLCLGTTCLLRATMKTLESATIANVCMLQYSERKPL